MRFNFSISISVFTDQLIIKYNFNHRNSNYRKNVAKTTVYMPIGLGPLKTFVPLL